MNGFSFGTKQASMVWLEPHRVHASGLAKPLSGPITEDTLLMALAGAAAGPSHWVVDDAWAPSILLRDIVELPSGAEAREQFFRWRYAQTLGLTEPQAVQALALDENAWLLVGMPEALRNAWVATSFASGRPLHSLLPRWLWIYNRMAATREIPGMLLSLCPDGQGRYTGTLAAWGRHLTLLRQWADPAEPEAWMQERVLPSMAYLQRDARSPQELLVWGAPHWPEAPVPTRVLAPEIPAQERR